MPPVNAGSPGPRRRAPSLEIVVAYFGHRFAGPLLASHFRHGLARAGGGAVRLEPSPLRFAARMVKRRLRRRPGGPVLSVMVHPALAVLWPLVPRAQRLYVIHDTTPHPGRRLDLRWRFVSWLDRSLAARSATVVALSAWSADDWRRDHAPEGQRVLVVPHPEMVGPAAGRPMRPPELVGLHEPYVLLFGRADRYKGVRELWPHLDRWRAATGHTVVVAGVGSAADVPPGAADDAGVRIVDRYLSEAEIDWLARGDGVLLLPYTSATQSGVLERFAAGPTVALGYAVGGLAEQLASLHPDLAVAPGRPVELLRRLDLLMADASLRAELARAKAERTRALDHRFVDALAELLGTPRPDASAGGAAVIDLTTEPETGTVTIHQRSEPGPDVDRAPR
ncbi:MAG: hypothetical protein OEY41_06635 [Acidimicrobiia bacterium]|nr:hypothetical protein [Acidimicrobiia bacterium]